MSFPYSLKSTTFLIGLGLTGSGAIGIGGWQFVETKHPTGDKQLLKEGFQVNIPKPELSADVATGKHSSGESPFKFQSYGCFQNFFPGATMNHDISKTEEITDNFSSDTVGDTNSSVKPIGCSLLNLSYSSYTATRTVGETSQKVTESEYIFKSEVTVKNDKFGLSLWTGVKKLPDHEIKGNQSTSQINMQFIYYLVFLTKDADGQSWSVKGGYSWMDASFNGGGATEQLHLVIPTKEDWYKLVKNYKQDSVSEFRSYSGIWEVSDKGNEIFQDIEIWAGIDSDKYEVVELLGRQFKKDTSAIDFSPTNKSSIYGYGYLSAEHIYVPGLGWKKLSSSGDKKKNIKDNLQTLYSAFAGKRGKWREIDEYCSSQRFRRISGEDLYKLQNFCYKKSS